MNFSVKNFGYGYDFGVSAFSVEAEVRTSISSPASYAPADGNVLDYNSDVTPESIAAVQMNSDRFRGDHTWEAVEGDDDLVSKP